MLPKLVYILTLFSLLFFSYSKRKSITFSSVNLNSSSIFCFEGIFLSITLMSLSSVLSNFSLELSVGLLHPEIINTNQARKKLIE